MRIVILGAGNVATNLVHSLKSQHDIVQLYSRSFDSVSQLAEVEGIKDFTTDLMQLRSDADMYILSISDASVETVAHEFSALFPNALLVHTAGTLPLSVIPNKRSGVMYPMQTFSKSFLIDFSSIPIFIEASSKEDLLLVRHVADSLSLRVYDLSSADRRYLHLAAVFLCNFSNHLATLTESLLQRHQIPFDVMLPLLDETTRKLHFMKPFDAQTGPAVRGDKNVMNLQLDLLNGEPGGEVLKTLYKVLSENIMSVHKHK